MMIVFLFVSILMLINFILEKLHIYKIKDGIKSLREEVVHLKAKLYDKKEVDIDDVVESKDQSEEIKKLNE